MPRIMIDQKGWAGFTGNMGTAKFVDGIADVSTQEAGRIGANIRIVEIDSEGNELGQISAAAEILRVRGLSAEVIAPRAGIPAEETEEETSEEFQVAIGEAEEVDPAFDAAIESTDTQAPKIHSRAELESIADTDGIRGLRGIAQNYGVKSTSIVELIDLIVAKQG
jgi:hypothetical protein